MTTQSFEKYQEKFLASGKSPWAIIWHCLCDPGFSHLVELRLVSDRQTDRHTMTAYSALA